MSGTILCRSAFERQMTSAPVHLSSLCVRNGPNDLRFVKARLNNNFHFEVIDKSRTIRIQCQLGEFLRAAVPDYARVFHCQSLTNDSLASLVAVLKRLNGADS